LREAESNDDGDDDGDDTEPTQTPKAQDSGVQVGQSESDDREPYSQHKPLGVPPNTPLKGIAFGDTSFLHKLFFGAI
jgi:hypothetical protein